MIFALARKVNIHRLLLHHEIVPDLRVKEIVDCIIDSGRRYSRRRGSRAPLMYQYYGTEYLGAAHGLMGILQMLLRQVFCSCFFG